MRVPVYLFDPENKKTSPLIIYGILLAARYIFKHLAISIIEMSVFFFGYWFF